jgi:hypothetical protein
MGGVGIFVLALMVRAGTDCAISPSFFVLDREFFYPGYTIHISARRTLQHIQYSYWSTDWSILESNCASLTAPSDHTWRPGGSSDRFVWKWTYIPSSVLGSWRWSWSFPFYRPRLASDKLHLPPWPTQQRRVYVQQYCDNSIVRPYVNTEGERFVHK